MRVFVTGATGFVGAWTAQALAARGHELTCLVRNANALARTQDALGFVVDQVIEGDITDADAVVEAMESCDAVVHCAAVVATDPRQAAQMHATNLLGAQNVLGFAVAQGCDPIVHTSSITALFASGIARLHADLPPADGGDAYGQSKSAVEQFARSLQEDGAPIVITYPGMVVGPGAAGRFGEVADGFVTVLRGGIVPGSDAGWLVIDVRDLAQIHAEILEPNNGPRRFMAGGAYLDAGQITEMFSAVTGRKIRRLPIPGVGLRALGSVVDGVCRLTGKHAVLTRAAMEYYTQMPPSDDGDVHDDLGITYRDVADTFRDCIESLAANDRLTAEQAGTAS